MSKYPFADLVFKKYPGLKYIIWINWFHSIFLLLLAWVVGLGLFRIVSGSRTFPIPVFTMMLLFPLVLLSIATVLFWSNSQLIKFNNRARLAVLSINAVFFLLLLFLNVKTLTSSSDTSVIFPLLYMSLCSYPVLQLTRNSDLVSEFS